MPWWWLWVWIGFIVLVILLPLGYGWGPPGGPHYRYRGRRGTIVELEEVPPEPQPPPRGHAWGIIDDLLWLAALPIGSGQWPFRRSSCTCTSKERCARRR